MPMTIIGLAWAIVAMISAFQVLCGLFFTIVFTNDFKEHGETECIYYTFGWLIYAYIYAQITVWAWPL